MKVKRRAGSQSVFHHLGSNTITSLQGKPPISEAKNPSIQPLQEGHPFLLKPRHSLLKATGQLNFLPEWSGKGFWEHIAFQTTQPWLPLGKGVLVPGPILQSEEQV